MRFNDNTKIISNTQAKESTCNSKVIGIHAQRFAISIVISFTLAYCTVNCLDNGTVGRLAINQKETAHLLELESYRKENNIHGK